LAYTRKANNIRVSRINDLEVVEMIVKKLSICALSVGALYSSMLLAEPVTSITIEDVGSGGIDAFSATLDTFSGAFRFSEIDDVTYLGSEAFTSDIAPLDTSAAQPAGSFSTGFLFTGQPFVPKTLGPVVADISIVGGNPILTFVNPVTDLPFAGDFGATTITEFVLGPQVPPDSDICGGTHIPLTVYWINRIDNTDQYRYKIAWTHCITPAEDPVFQFFRANWRLEGIMTAPDTTPPTVINVVPTDGAMGVPTNSSVSITFSEEMNPATLTTASFAVTPSSGGSSECDSITTVDNISFTCNPVGGVLTANTLFDVVVTTAACDGSADTSVCIAAPFTSQFTTAAGVDQSPPIVLSTDPADGSTNVLINSSVIVVFNEPMAPETLGAITLSDSSGQIEAVVSSAADNETFTLTPNSDLSFNAVYTINVDDTIATDLSGNFLSSSVSSTFTTEAVTTLTVDGVTVTISDAPGASLQSLEIQTEGQAGGTPPDRIDFDDEYITYTVNGVTTNQITVTIDFPTSITGKSIFKVINGVYTELLEGGAIGEYQVIDDDTITIIILDNGPQDSDSTIGVITDPIVAGFDEGPLPTPGSLGGCSITPYDVSLKDRSDYLVLGVFLFLLFVLRQRKSRA
jgi:hypothetical protein